MKTKLNNIRYTPGAFHVSMLLLRLVFSILMIPHGYSKLKAFDQINPQFINFLGLGPEVSLCLVIGAEIGCSLLLLLGLYTRLALVPLLITATVITFVAHNGEIFGDAYGGFSYLTVYVVLMLLGPGKYSVDAAISGTGR